MSRTLADVARLRAARTGEAVADAEQVVVARAAARGVEGACPGSVVDDDEARALLAPEEA